MDSKAIHLEFCFQRAPKVNVSSWSLHLRKIVCLSHGIFEMPSNWSNSIPSQHQHKGCQKVHKCNEDRPAMNNTTYSQIGSLLCVTEVEGGKAHKSGSETEISCWNSSLSHKKIPFSLLLLWTLCDTRCAMQLSKQLSHWINNKHTLIFMSQEWKFIFVPKRANNVWHPVCRIQHTFLGDCRQLH